MAQPFGGSTRKIHDYEMFSVCGLGLSATNTLPNIFKKIKSRKPKINTDYVRWHHDRYTFCCRCDDS